MSFKTFVQKYKQRQEEKKNPKDDEWPSITSFYRLKTSFVLYAREDSMSMSAMVGYHVERCFTLDDEDLDYLYKKYYPELEKEEQEAIEEIKNKYKDL